MLEDILGKDYKTYDKGSILKNIVACRQEGYRPLSLQETYELLKRHRDEQGSVEYKEWGTGSTALTGKFRAKTKQICIYNSDKAANLPTLNDLIDPNAALNWNGSLLRSKRFFNERHSDIHSLYHSTPYEPEQFKLPIRIAHKSTALKECLSLSEQQAFMLPGEIDAVSMNLYDPDFSDMPEHGSICRPLLIHNFESDGFVWLNIRAGTWYTHAPLVGCRR